MFYYGIGGNDMKNNHLFIFSINRVEYFFKDLMKIDIYDRYTIEWFSRKILKEVSIEEMYEIEETILIEINKNSRTNSTFWAGLSVIIALYIGIYAIIISLSSEFEVNYDFTFIILVFILLPILAIVLLNFKLEQLVNKKWNKLHDLIRILIHLKSEKNT